MRENNITTDSKKYLELNIKKNRKIKSKEFLPNRRRNKIFINDEIQINKDVPNNDEYIYYKNLDY